MTTQANEKSPNEVSPQNATSLGMARTKTTNVQPSVMKFRTALRASSDDGASSRVGGFTISACTGCSIVVGNFDFLNPLMISVGRSSLWPHDPHPHFVAGGLHPRAVGRRPRHG